MKLQIAKIAEEKNEQIIQDLSTFWIFPTLKWEYSYKNRVFFKTSLSIFFFFFFITSPTFSFFRLLFVVIFDYQEYF